MLLRCLLLTTLLVPLPAQAADPGDALGDTSPLRAFFDDLSSLSTSKAQRQVRIAWYGDSAIVSDGYTSVVRERLQKRFGDAGPGFVIVAPTFDGYLREGVRLKRTGWTSNAVISDGVESGRYGFGGVVASGYAGASATFEAKAPLGAIELFYEGATKGGRLEIFAGKGKDPIASVDTAAASGPQVFRHALETPNKVLKVKVAGGPVKLYGVVLEGDKRGVQLDALGVLGIRARRWLNADKDHLAAQVAARKPDLIVMNFGGNERVDPALSESAHKADIAKTLAAFRAGAKDAACLVVGPLAHGIDKDGKMVLDPALDTIYAAQRAVASEAGCAFFDTIAAMGGKKKALKTWRDKKWLSGDYAHLNGKGHDELGRLIAEWLEAGFERSVARAQR